MDHKNKMGCECDSCNLTRRMTAVLKRIDDYHIHAEVREIFNELWGQLTSVELELGVRNAKEAGTWQSQ